MTHETLSKIIEDVNFMKDEIAKNQSVKEEYKKLDIFLCNDTATRLMPEADTVKLEDGLLALQFDDIEVVLKLYGKECDVQLMRITDVYQWEYSRFRKFLLDL